MEKKNKLLFAAAALVFVFSTVFFLRAAPSEAAGPGWIDEKQLGELCIGQMTPVSHSSEGREETEKRQENGEATAEKPKTDSGEGSKENQAAEKPQETKATGKPLVIIYHTHSTESYLPYKESNYHREAEEGTVRDVGNVLTEELMKRGINVIHDKTLHDRPSYNESYNRSLETIESLIKKYPTAVYIIDLHRDAAPSSASEGKYIEIEGKRVAKFSMVVGTANNNYTELYAFAKKVSHTAEKNHKGFGGAIMEQNYKYNEYVSDRALLLEIGNNKNTIEESRLCAVYFAETLAGIIKSEQ